MTQPIVLVLGMHRSGTSLVAQVLAAHGFVTGTRVIGASDSNARGHLEDRVVVRINKRLLLHAGGSWDAPPAFPDGWLEAPFVQRQAAQARRHADRLRQGEARAFLKDPRCCLTLPFWRATLG
ncbi:MAG: hypothetical protein ACOCX4_10365, partial [Planctomycetota bacterium]